MTGGPIGYQEAYPYKDMQASQEGLSGAGAVTHPPYEQSRTDAEHRPVDPQSPPSARLGPLRRPVGIGTLCHTPASLIKRRVLPAGPAHPCLFRPFTGLPYEPAWGRDRLCDRVAEWGLAGRPAALPCLAALTAASPESLRPLTRAVHQLMHHVALAGTSDM